MISDAPRLKKGFTLIEMLVALLIMALIFVLSYQALTTLLTTRTRVPQDINRYSQIERFFDRLEYDFTHLSWQSPVSPTGHKLSPLMVDESGKNGALTTLTLSRFSTQFPHSADSLTPLYTSGQLIGYRLRDGALEMLVYPTLYLPLDARFNAPQVYTVLPNIKTFRVEVLPYDSVHWQRTYPPLSVEGSNELTVGGALANSTINPLPKAIRLTINGDGLQDEVVRIFERIY